MGNVVANWTWTLLYVMSVYTLKSLYHQFPDSVKCNFNILMFFVNLCFTIYFLMNHAVSCIV